MTENENQKLDLLIKMFEQQSRRIDQIESDRRADRAEWKAAREEDRAEIARQFDQMEQTRKEDRAETTRQFEQMEQARKEDRAEWKATQEKDRAENTRQFERLEHLIHETKQELLKAIQEEKHERERLEAKVEKVYEARNQVTVSFSRSFAATNAFIAGMIAIIVSLVMNK